MLFDISPPISPALAVWPGDVPFGREVTADMRAGAAATSSVLRTTAHIGAHADAPSHYGLAGAAIDACNLDVYLGPCELVRLRVGPTTAVTPALLPHPPRAARLLLATGTYPDPTRFNEDFAALTVELIDELHARGVRLVGLDTPSVDLYADADLPVHRRLLQHGLAALEGLRLEHVPEGVYELIALPLKLVGCEASPVRAVLRPLPASDRRGDG